MKKLIFLITILIMALTTQESSAATACSATADNGSTCSISCNEGTATCIAGAKSVICVCELTPQPKGSQSFTLTSFAAGERDYFVTQLKPFILSLNSQSATALANALDQVVNAVDQNNPSSYNEAEWNYYDKRLELSENERQALDNWVAQNAFYH